MYLNYYLTVALQTTQAPLNIQQTHKQTIHNCLKCKKKCVVILNKTQIWSPVFFLLIFCNRSFPFKKLLAKCFSYANNAEFTDTFTQNL